MTAKVFIDGDVGTTGLQIVARLEGRADIELLRLPDAKRKDPGRRRDMLQAADLAILCLPDDAARESAALANGAGVKLIDASTAHRTADGWAYGFPEYDAGHVAAIAAAERVANPGCYAITSVAILHPLVAAGLVPADWPVTINAVSGYSGGGKSLIAAFEDPSADNYTDDAFYAYGLGLSHKHVPEITRWSGLSHAPVFVPSVGRYHRGMLVQVPLALWALPGAPTAEAVHAALADHYAGRRFVNVAPLTETAAMTKLDPEDLNGTNELRLHVFANPKTEQAVVMGLIDNLGKGASGQCVQNMNIMLGVPEDTGL
ncbi:MAG: N-acetyl-gamma-glutamyl-phosphate reductase [Rhodospirillaceae bacterium]